MLSVLRTEKNINFDDFVRDALSIVGSGELRKSLAKAEFEFGASLKFQVESSRRSAVICYS